VADGNGSPSVSLVIVCFNSAAELRRTLPAVAAELGEGDELIVADNGSEDDTRAVVEELAPAARLIELGSNHGFAAACNAAASQAGGELLVILNPDAKPLGGFGEAIRRPVTERRGWDAWMALVACDDGTRINTVGNRVHFTGIAWAGGHGDPLPTAPRPQEVAVASGACLAIPLARWRELGGFPPEFFLYHEDVDLSFRVHLARGRVGVEPAAIVDHDYEFAGRSERWRWLERNRWAFLIRVYPSPLLLLLAPALLLTELALIPASIAGGWAGQKLLANLDAIRWLPRLLRERRAIQARRAASSGELAAWLTADLDSPFIPGIARSGPARLALRAYWRLVRALLGR
jgi:GT2 family glycosyltransferase